MKALKFAKANSRLVLSFYRIIWSKLILVPLNYSVDGFKWFLALNSQLKVSMFTFYAKSFYRSFYPLILVRDSILCTCPEFSLHHSSIPKVYQTFLKHAFAFHIWLTQSRKGCSSLRTKYSICDVRDSGLHNQAFLDFITEDDGNVSITSTIFALSERHNLLGCRIRATRAVFLLILCMN